MARHIAGSIVVVLALLGAAPPVRAQEASYCNGVILAERFGTIVAPGPGGRASYSVLLRNTQGWDVNFQLAVTGPFLGRPPVAMQTIRASGMMNIALGYSPNLPGVPPLRGEQLAQVTRVACF